MPTSVGDRLFLPAPDLDELPDGPAAFTALINALNPQPAIDLQGLLSTRPVSTPATPGIRGRLYTVIGDPDASQNGVVYRDYGTGWLPIGASSGAIAWPGDISPPTITANQNDYNPAGLAGASTLRLASSGAFQVTGLAGGVDGRLMIVHNVGANPISFVREASASATANRFLFSAALATDDSMLLRWDATSSRWRCIAKHIRLVEVYGSVSGAGGIVSGAGFSPSRTGIGQYTITFATPFLIIPTVFLSSNYVANASIATCKTTSTSAIQVVTNTHGGDPIDADFSFNAKAQG